MARTASGMLAIGGLLGVLWGAPAKAEDTCECRARADRAETELSRHKSAFAGRAVEVRGEGDSTVVRFAVHRVWKGPRSKEIVVKTSGPCAARFETGADYLVYADGEDALTTDRCSGDELAAAGRAVRQLDLHTGRGSNPLHVPAPGSMTAQR